METAALHRPDIKAPDRPTPTRTRAARRRGDSARANGNVVAPSSSELRPASPRELPTFYRNRATQLLRYAPAAAEAFNEAAELLEAALLALDAELLTPEEVEDEGLCSAETVRRHVRQQKVENVGTAGRIQIRRADAPSTAKNRTFAQLTREVARSARIG
jgi:hypothetical protein